MTAAENKAVFLSYASQDADAARRICETLRASGVEVWFDADGGLEHGDEWDAKIRRQIKECVLFIPVISSNTQARHEGYFRIEWDLAAERARGIASGVPFILPVVIDDTREPDALVPDRFRAVQWTKLRAGEVPPDVQQRFLKLWSHRTGVLKHAAARSELEPGRPRPGARDEGVASPTETPQVGRRVPAAAWIAAAALALLAGGYFFAKRPSEPPLPAAQNAGAGTRPSTTEKPTAPLSEARNLVAQARLQLDRPEMARVELDTAESFCKRAADLDSGDPEVWATWSQVNTWFVYYNFDGSLARREAARDYAARAMQLAPRSFEARLAQACYWLRGAGLDVGFADGTPTLHAAEGERLLRELHVERPTEPRTLLMLGFVQVWKDLTRPDRYELLERATKNPAFAAEAWKEIGWINFFQGDPVAALSAVDRSIAAQPTWNNLWLKTVLATVWLGDRELAKATLDRMPAAALQEDVGLYLVYWVYSWRQEPLVALGLLERQPRDWLRMSGYVGPKALLTGKLRRMANQPELARRDFLRARELVEQQLTTNANNRNLLSLKAQALHFLGETEDARRTDRLARDLGGNVGTESDVLFLSPDAVFDAANKNIDSPHDRPNGEWFFTAAAWRQSPVYADLRKHPRYPALIARLEGDPRFSPSAKAAKPTHATPAPDSKSVAVLAFVNQSDDQANEYISDGLADELQMVLKKIPGLRVAAQTSAFSFKGKHATAKEVGEKLGMAHVVSGTVLKSGNRVKITARLNHAATNEEIWWASFGPLELTDLFATQSEIAQQIVAGLRGLLTGETGTTPAAAAAQAEIKAQVLAATKGGTKNSEAHQLYLQGKFLVNQHTVESAIRAGALLRRAVDLDPQFALAWAALSEAGRVRSGFGDTKLDFDEGLKVAREAADRAMALGPDLVTALLVQENLLRTYHFDWKRAAELLQRAKVLAPSDPAVLTQSSELAFAMGQVERAVELGKEATALDPINPRLLMSLAYALTELRRYDEARVEFQRIIDLSPAAPWGYSGIGLMLTAQGKAAEAIEAAAKVETKWERLYVLAIAEWARGNQVASDSALNEMIASVADIAAVQIAWAYAYRREADRAFEWLDRAYRQHDGGLAWTKPNFALKSLHSDPRWPAFWKKFGLADDQLK